MPETAIVDWITLGLIPGIGNKTILQLIERFGDPGAVFEACKKGSASCKGIKIQLLTPLSAPEAFQNQAKAILQGLQKGNAVALCLNDTDYPAFLREISDPPHVLYAQGNLNLLHSPCIAMVGSRAATAYGKRAAFTLARDLAERKITVVSGLAMGVDSEAHRGALSVQGGTIGVLGCGLDVTYPRQNVKLYAEIRSRGLLLSEYPLGTSPDGFRFPARNRIIAGLSKGVVVVEAARKSGSLITAEMAMEEGREVFAVPGQIDSFKSSGAHWLLQQGAKLVQSAEDILVECGNDFVAFSGPADQVKPDIDEESAALFAQIDVYPEARNELIVRSGLSSAKVAELLLLLELEGLIEMLPGDEVRKIEKGS